MTIYEKMMVCIAVAGITALSWVGGVDYQRRHQRQPIHYTEKEFYVQEPDPHMIMRFDKDRVPEIVLIDSKGKVWGRIRPFEGDCSFGKSHVSHCAFEGAAANQSGPPLGPGDSITY